MGWVKCSERMPKEGEAVLCVVRYKEQKKIDELFGKDEKWFMYALLVFENGFWRFFHPTPYDYGFNCDFCVTSWLDGVPEPTEKD